MKSIRIFTDTYFLDPEIVSIPLRSIKSFFFPSSLRCLRQLSGCVFFLMSEFSKRLLAWDSTYSRYWSCRSSWGVRIPSRNPKVISLDRLRGCTHLLTQNLSRIICSHWGREEVRESSLEVFNNSVIGKLFQLVSYLSTDFGHSVLLAGNWKTYSTDQIYTESLKAAPSLRPIPRLQATSGLSLTSWLCQVIPCPKNQQSCVYMYVCMYSYLCMSFVLVL